jgi:glycosyltransferase involved in cell wall biosynthesis
MRVAVYHNLTSGGSKREAYELTKQLMLAGHIVHLYRPSTANEQFLPLNGFIHEEFLEELDLISDLSLRLPGIRKYVDLVNLERNLRRLDHVAGCVGAKIEAGGYDFVFAHHDRIVQSPYLFRHLKTPSVYYCAEPMREYYERPISRPYQLNGNGLGRAQRAWYAPERQLRKTLIKHADSSNVQHATLLLTNSYFSAESIYRAYGLRAHVSYLGVDTDVFKPLGLERENFVLSVGAVAPLKGYDFLIDALAKVTPAQRPSLVIVGNTASQGETRYLEQLAAKREVGVTFRVNVTDEELVQLYNQASAFVYAPVLEPFGFAPLEAMACATPVIAVKEGGVRESVVHGSSGFLVPRDSDTFALALIRLIENPILARAIGANGRAHILDCWTWPQAYCRLMDNIKILQQAEN